MSEIVIAYARSDAAAAERLIGKLEQRGFAVIRDLVGRPRGARRTPVVRRNAAPPRIILWSRHYAASTRAAAPRGRTALLAARLDVAPLSNLVRSGAVDLRAWRGREDHRGWKALLAALAAAMPAETPRAAQAGAPAKSAAPIKVSGAAAAAPAKSSGKSGSKTADAAKASARGAAKVSAGKPGVGPALLWLAGAAALAAGGAVVFLQSH